MVGGTCPLSGSVHASARPPFRLCTSIYNIDSGLDFDAPLPVPPFGLMEIYVDTAWSGSPGPELDSARNQISQTRFPTKGKKGTVNLSTLSSRVNPIELATHVHFLSSTAKHADTPIYSTWHNAPDGS